MNRIRFRAECLQDICDLMDILPMNKVSQIQIKAIPENIPDKSVLMVTELKPWQLRRYMGRIEDGHVMVETVNFENKYSGYRLLEDKSGIFLPDPCNFVVFGEGE